jgi:type IV fimbrial biogenesis protein FimT
MNKRPTLFKPAARPVARRGFTMVELMVVVAIVAIGAAVALPDLASFLRRNRVQSATSELLSAITRARVEAARTGSSGAGAGVPYTVCQSANSETADLPAAPAPSCVNPPTADGWVAGAIVFADANGDGRRTAGEQLVLSIPPAPSNITITLHTAVVAGSPAIPYVLYAPNGKLHGNVTGMRLTVTPKGFPVAVSRFVCLQGGGRPTEISYATLKSDPRYAACATLDPSVP